MGYRYAAIFVRHRTIELVRSVMINQFFPVTIVSIIRRKAMVYMVLGYCLASLAFVLPYFVRYVRIMRHETSQNSLKV